MSEQEYHQLREASWRRRLTPTEAAALQQYLSAHPELGEEWQIEAELNQLLERLPEAPPVASNFTARVLQTARQEAAAAHRAPARSWPVWWGFNAWLPKFALVGMAIGLVVSLGYHQHQLSKRAALARNVMELTDVVSASDPETLQDYEPIRQLSDSQPKADIELIALMK